MASAGLAAAADATVFEPNDPRLVQVELKLPRLPEAWDGVRIVQLSDLHYDQHFSVHPLRKAIDVVNRLEPDFIALTGDFITTAFLPSYRHPEKHVMRAIGPCVDLVGQLRSRMGTFAVLGNHDVASGQGNVRIILGSLAAKKIEVLRNHALPMERSGSRIWIAGVDDALVGTPDLDVALQPVPRDEPVILLAHEPDLAEHVARYPVDLQLSGHSHGGQVRLPLLGAAYLPEMGQKFPMGLYRVGPLTLYTNVGLGTLGIPVRWNCPPEITLFTLRTSTEGKPQEASHAGPVSELSDY